MVKAREASHHITRLGSPTLLAPAAEIAAHAPARERVDAVRARAAVQTWRADAVVNV